MTPAEIAREALLKLAADKLPPTPEHYRRAFCEIAHQPDETNVFARELLEYIEQQPGISRLSPRLGRLRQALEGERWHDGAELSFSVMQALAEQQTAGQDWARILRELVRLWDMPLSISQSHKRETLERVLSVAGAQPLLLYGKLGNLLDNWKTSAASMRPADSLLTFDELPDVADESSGMAGSFQGSSGSGPACPDDGAGMSWRTILRGTLVNGVSPRLKGYPELAQELMNLVSLLDETVSGHDLEMLGRRLKRFWIRLELVLEQEDRLANALAGLLGVLLDNISELVGTDSRVGGQVEAMRDILSQAPLSMRKIYQLEASLKEAVYQQGLIKHSLDEATDSMRSMLDSFISRVGMLANQTDTYRERFSRYGEEVALTHDVVGLHGILGRLMQDTRAIHTDLASAHDELQGARHQVEAVNARIELLEAELVEASTKIKEDQLTGALNRRGLDEQFIRETSRAERNGQPLALALIDIDNFKQLNDRYGHRTGDNALRYVVDLVSERVRPSDAVARFGGEEFVVLMPDTSQEQALELIERLQRDLTKTFFLANEDRLVITFSAGIAVWSAGESELDLIERADHAMYRAKLAGKNRVLAATDEM